MTVIGVRPSRLLPAIPSLFSACSVLCFDIKVTPWRRILELARFRRRWYLRVYLAVSGTSGRRGRGRWRKCVRREWGGVVERGPAGLRGIAGFVLGRNIGGITRLWSY